MRAPTAGKGHTDSAAQIALFVLLNESDITRQPFVVLDEDVNRGVLTTFWRIRRDMGLLVKMPTRRKDANYIAIEGVVSQFGQVGLPTSFGPLVRDVWRAAVRGKYHEARNLLARHPQASYLGHSSLNVDAAMRMLAAFPDEDKSKLIMPVESRVGQRIHPSYDVFHIQMFSLSDYALCINPPNSTMNGQYLFQGAPSFTLLLHRWHSPIYRYLKRTSLDPDVLVLASYGLNESDHILTNLSPWDWMDWQGLTHEGVLRQPDSRLASASPFHQLIKGLHSLVSQWEARRAIDRLLKLQAYSYDGIREEVDGAALALHGWRQEVIATFAESTKVEALRRVQALDYAGELMRAIWYSTRHKTLRNTAATKYQLLQGEITETLSSNGIGEYQRWLAPLDATVKRGGVPCAWEDMLALAGCGWEAALIRRCQALLNGSDVSAQLVADINHDDSDWKFIMDLKLSRILRRESKGNSKNWEERFQRMVTACRDAQSPPERASHLVEIPELPVSRYRGQMLVEIAKKRLNRGRPLNRYKAFKRESGCPLLVTVMDNVIFALDEDEYNRSAPTTEQIDEYFVTWLRDALQRRKQWQTAVFDRLLKMPREDREACIQKFKDAVAAVSDPSVAFDPSTRRREDLFEPYRESLKQIKGLRTVEDVIACQVHLTLVPPSLAYRAMAEACDCDLLKDFIEESEYLEIHNAHIQPEPEDIVNTLRSCKFSRVPHYKWTVHRCDYKNFELTFRREASHAVLAVRDTDDDRRLLVVVQFRLEPGYCYDLKTEQWGQTYEEAPLSVFVRNAFELLDRCGAEATFDDWFWCMSKQHFLVESPAHRMLN